MEIRIRLPLRAFMKTYEIWAEGFIFSLDEQSGCWLFGTSNGNNFREACDNFFKEYYSGINDYNSETGTYWGCRLFDNRADAAKFNG